MAVCLSSSSLPVNTKWSLATAAWRGTMVLPPVIWLKVWMANGAVPSEAGSKSAYTRSVAPGSTVASLSTRCAHTICWVVLSVRAVSASGQCTRGGRAHASRNSRRPTAKMPPLCRISSSFALSGTGV